MKYLLLIVQALLLLAGTTGIVVFTLLTLMPGMPLPWICAAFASLCAAATFAYVRVIARPDHAPASSAAMSQFRHSSSCPRSSPRTSCRRRAP
jgi:hypothetical protein